MSRQPSEQTPVLFPSIPMMATHKGINVSKAVKKPITLTDDRPDCYHVQKKQEKASIWREELLSWLATSAITQHNLLLLQLQGTQEGLR